jgi:hypothetical protein
MDSRIARRLGIAAGVLLAGGCMQGPNNGSTFTSPPVQLSIAFHGYDDFSQNTLTVQALSDANLPVTSANFVTLGTTQSSTTPTYYRNDPNPAYAWSLDAAVVPSFFQLLRWQQGGLARVRVLRSKVGFGQVNTEVVFDDDIADCATAHQNDSWKAITAECETPYYNSNAGFVATLVSTAPVPADSADPTEVPQYLSFQGTSTASDTDNYYKATGADPTLGAFQLHYDFGKLFTDQADAYYFNAGDLGLGRSMHCKSFSTPNGPGRACYVTNYFGDIPNANPSFNGDPTTAMHRAVNNQSPVATVAMVYTPPAGAPNAVRFMVFDSNGNRQNFAKLDKTGGNTAVPNNCLVCHGGSANYQVGSSVTGAHFLPFDGFSFKYGDPNVDASLANYTYDKQKDQLRRLNAHIANTAPTSAITELVNGMYAPNGPGDANAVANDTFIPSGWQTNEASKKLYNEVVKHYCRTCHVSNEITAIDWHDYQDFKNDALTIAGYACAPSQHNAPAHQMPQAEVTQRNFWQSPARAHLVSALGLATACKP